MICSWFYREPLLLGPNNFFPLTRYFCDTYHLMHNKMKSFVYIFVTNCQFSQITLPEYTQKAEIGMLYHINNTFRNTVF